MTSAKALTVRAGVLRDLRKLSDAERYSVAALVALRLAESLDEQPTAAAAKELLNTLSTLTGDKPSEATKDPLDEMSAKRQQRLGFA